VLILISFNSYSKTPQELRDLIIQQKIAVEELETQLIQYGQKLKNQTYIISETDQKFFKQLPVYLNWKSPKVRKIYYQSLLQTESQFAVETLMGQIDGETNVHLSMLIIKGLKNFLINASQFDELIETDLNKKATPVWITQSLPKLDHRAKAYFLRLPTHFKKSPEIKNFFDHKNQAYVRKINSRTPQSSGLEFESPASYTSRSYTFAFFILLFTLLLVPLNGYVVTFGTKREKIN
jgi:hypothetical protein